MESFLWSRETGLTVPSRVSSLIRHTQAESGAHSWNPPAFRGGVHLFMPPTAIGSVSSLSGHVIAYRWRLLPRAHPHGARSLQCSPSNGCCLFRYHPRPNFVRLFFLMNVWSSHVAKSSIDQPGKVANPARGQLNREK